MGGGEPTKLKEYESIEGGGGRALLEGEGGEQGSSRAIAERSQVVRQRLGRLLAVGNAVGAGVGVWECLWGRAKAGVFGGEPPPPPSFKRFPGGGGGGGNKDA